MISSMLRVYPACKFSSRDCATPRYIARAVPPESVVSMRFRSRAYEEAKADDLSTTARRRESPRLTSASERSERSSYRDRLIIESAADITLLSCSTMCLVVVDDIGVVLESNGRRDYAQSRTYWIQYGWRVRIAVPHCAYKRS